MAKNMGATLTPTLNTAQLAAVVNEVAQSSPIAREAVSQACQRQSDGLIRTRQGTLYATGRFTAAAAAPLWPAGTSVDLFNVPVGQVGSGFGVALTKAQTSMQTSGLLASEAYQCNKMGISFHPSTTQANTAEQIAETIDFLQNNVSVELSLGGQDVQLLGLCSQWPDLDPQSMAGAAAAAIANSGNLFGMTSNGWDKVVPLDLFIPQQVPFKVTLRINTNSALALAPVAATLIDIRVTFYGVSVTAIQA